MTYYHHFLGFISHHISLFGWRYASLLDGHRENGGNWVLSHTSMMTCRRGHGLFALSACTMQIGMQVPAYLMQMLDANETLIIGTSCELSVCHSSDS